MVRVVVDTNVLTGMLLTRTGYIIELAVAGGAAIIVTNNIRDFRAAELRFPDLRIVTPREVARGLR